MKESIIKETIEKMLAEMAISAEVTTSLDTDGVTWWVNISSGSGNLFLNRDGEALFAFSYIAKEILRKQSNTPEIYPTIVIDINGFQKKRVDVLKTTAHMMAERARYFKSSIALEPMSAYDRRIVHEYLSSATDLKTESDGEGRERHVVIKWVG